MADLSIWVHGPEFGSAIIQSAILKELIKKKHGISVDINVVKKNKPIFDYYFSKQIKNGSFTVKKNELIHQLAYSRSMNLSITKTLTKISKNIITKSIPLIRQFHKRVYKNRPRLIISAGLAEIGILAKLMKKPRPPTIYIFNYLLEYLRFFKRSESLSRFSRKIFIKNYANYDHSIIQTFFPEKDYKIKHELDNLILTNIIAREATTTKEKLRKDLGLSSDEKLIFLAMGGAKFFKSVARVAKGITREHPDIRFLLLPREAKEIKKFRSLGNFIVPRNITFETQNYVLASDVIIAKCGFSTIAEAIKFGTNIISVHLPNHAEVTETEILLKNNNIIKNSIKFSDIINTKKIKKQLYKKIISEVDNKESILAMKKIKTNGAQQVAKIYLNSLENG